MEAAQESSKVERFAVEMATIARKLTAVFMLMLPYSTLQAESNLQAIFELGITRAAFDNRVVAGNSINMEYALAFSYKSLIEFGYTSIMEIANASMDVDAGIKSDAGFYASGKMYYLRGSIPLNSGVNIFALAGRSRFTIEATSAYGCLFFCGDVLTMTTESNYLYKESGMALGVGVSYNTRDNRQVIIQYVDYNYGGETEFRVFTLSYRWLLGIPI